MEKNTTTTLPDSTAKAEELGDLSGLVLRPLRVSDAQAFHAMDQHADVFHHANVGLPYDTLARTHEWIETLAPSTVALVAVVGETLVGHAELYVNGRRRGHSASLGLAVRENCQRRGIGSRMLAELIDVADNWLGLRRVELNVFTDNHAALVLYRKFGFEIEVRQRGSVLRDGELVDSYLMARLVDAMPLASDDR